MEDCAPYSIVSENSSELAKELDAAKEQILAELNQNIENLRTRAVVRMLETSEQIVQHWKAKEQAHSATKLIKLHTINSALIQVTNDHKEKYQSWEATITKVESSPMSMGQITLIGYGDCEEEAVANLNLGFQKLIQNIVQDS